MQKLMTWSDPKILQFAELHFIKIFCTKNIAAQMQGLLGFLFIFTTIITFQ